MKLQNIVCPQGALAGLLSLGLALLTPTASAAIPSGELQIQISDPTNHVWDISLITPLQAPELEFDEDETEVSFSAPFVQTSGGKLAGEGETEINVASELITGAVAGTYVAKGTVTASKGITRFVFSSTARGTAMIDERPRTLTSSLAVKVALDSINEVTTGTSTMKAAAAGYGSLKQTEEIEFPWEEVVGAMGNGNWTLHLSLTNDLVKKVGGTATVDLSGGGSLGFTVKGTYKERTDSTLLILTADAESKGSSLKVNLKGDGSATLSGKLTGQTVKTAGTAEED